MQVKGDFATIAATFTLLWLITPKLLIGVWPFWSYFNQSTMANKKVMHVFRIFAFHHGGGQTPLKPWNMQNASQIILQPGALSES